MPRKAAVNEEPTREKIAPKSFLYRGQHIELRAGDIVMRCDHDVEPFYWFRVPPSWRIESGCGDTVLPTWLLNCQACEDRYRKASSEIGVRIGTVFTVEEGAED